MADEYILKSYDGGAETTTLTTPFTIGGTTLGVANGSTFPDGSAGPFVVVVDRGLATEEKFLIDTTTGVNGTTFNIQQVAYDGTSASAHSVGAVVEHCLDAYSIEQANRYVNLQTTRGDLVSRTTTTTGRLAAGTNNHVLMADSTQALGLKYAQVGELSIADGAVTAAKLSASALLATTIPTGSITMFGAGTAPAGWEICDGRAISRTTFSTLFSAIGTTYGAGDGSSTFNLPNLKGRVPVGRDPGDASFDVLGEIGGAKTHTLTQAEMPVHNHSGPSHTHPGGSHTHAYPHIHIVSSRSLNAGTPSGSGNTFLLASGGYYSLTGTSDQDPETTEGPGTYNTGGATPANTGDAGSNSPHNNLQPYVVLNYIIKT